MLNSVLFPEPLGPMIEMYSPRLMEIVTPLSACTSASPILYERLTSMVRTVCSARVEAVEPSSAERVMTHRILARMETTAIAVRIARQTIYL